MNIYIQKWNKEFPQDIMFSAFMGFDYERLRDEKVKINFFEDIETVPTRKDEYGHQPLVIGFIEDTIRYFEKCGVSELKYTASSIPDALNSYRYLLRGTNVMTLGDFKYKDDRLPIFVKPYTKLKKFASGLIKEKSSRKELFHKNEAGEILDDNMYVLTSDPIDILSEYRCFIKEGKLMGIRHYQGDFTIFPNINMIKEMVETYQPTAPVAYSLDVGVIDRNYGINAPLDTVLIECQDMWSIGPYGLDPLIYISMLKKRWFEIFKIETNLGQLQLLPIQ